VKIETEAQTGEHEAWEALATDAGGLPTEDVPWSLAASAVFPGEERFLLVDGEQGCEAAAPLVRRAGVLELSGARELGEPADFLARSPEALEKLCHQVISSRRALLLHRVREGSPTLAALREAGGSRVHLSTRPSEGYPTIELDERWRECGGGLSSSRRSALRRSRRKAERQGEVEPRLLHPGPDEVEELLDRAFAIEARSWKGEEGTALTQVPAMESFFRRYAAELARRGTLRLDFLEIGGHPVAMQLGAEWNNRHWLFKIGYDAGYRACSPGQILLAESVAAAAQNGLESYELLGSRDAWTDAWTELVHPCVKILVLPLSGRGLIAVGSIGAGEARRGLERRVRAGKRRTVDRAKQRYVAGPELADALEAERRYARLGYPTSVGFWNGRGDGPEKVAGEALASAAALEPGGEVSIKPAEMGGMGPALEDLVEACSERGLRLHFDALRADTAELTRDKAIELAARLPGRIGCTLPGRWSRSLADAELLRSHDLCVRVVKGEVADADAPEAEPEAGFLALVETLSSGSCHVEVATQDATLTKRALGLLAERGTSCEHQVLHGASSSAAVRVARRLEVEVRVYIPYGTGRLPYDRAALGRRPRTMLSLGRDLLPLGTRQPLLRRWR
jgi:CelD/BcsL family acetyltransferase involved in cellulose biosynthesis